MIGIYQLRNKINNKVYIGQSIDINARIKTHFRDAFNENTHTYEYPLARAIRKYGVENFESSVLEKINIDLLTEREQFWINEKNSLVPNGYNQEDAINPKRGEDCNWAILSDTQTKEIIDLLKNTRILMNVIAEYYGVTGSCIEDINKGRRRVQYNITYPLRIKSKSLAHQGENQNTAILTEEDVFNIRHRYVYENLESIFEDYKNKISKSGFKKVVYGATWKHQPCYKKQQKIWVYPN